MRARRSVLSTGAAGFSVALGLSSCEAVIGLTGETALPEGGGGGGGGSSSCLSQLQGDPGCTSCVESLCGSELTNAESGCADFIDCVCPGGTYSSSNLQSCESLAEEASCSSQGQALSSCEASSCQSQCAGDAGLPASSGGSSSGSGGGTGSSSGAHPDGGPACSWTGTWSLVQTTNWSATMTLTETGAAVSGTYTHSGGRINGTTSGDQLSATWNQITSGGACANGPIDITMSADCSGFTGGMRYCNASGLYLSLSGVRD